jgi:hypothetical protein
VGTVRWVVAACTVLGLLAGAAFIGSRVLRPREMLTRPSVPYPAAVSITDERPFAELRAAPIVIEGRLRVYAETRRVWADAPVGGVYESTPYWAFRRWPQQVIGVVQVSTAQGPYVVTQWNDGALIAIDARRGVVAWRAMAPQGSATGYDGRRTGASVVYEPRSLLTGQVGTAAVVVATSAGSVSAFDGATGTPLWHRDTGGRCEPLAWTGEGFLAVPDCTGRSVALLGLADGHPASAFQTPLGPSAPDLCELGRTDCHLVTAAGQAWLLGADGNLTRVRTPEPGAMIAEDRVVYPTATGLAARRLTDGVPLWTWTGKGRLLAADNVAVYVLTPDRSVVGLSPVTGQMVLVGCASDVKGQIWQVGHVYTSNGDDIAIERLTGAGLSAKDSIYYYGPRPIALVELYAPAKLPSWKPEYAACLPPVTRVN